MYRAQQIQSYAPLLNFDIEVYPEHTFLAASSRLTKLDVVMHLGKAARCMLN